MTSLLNGAPAGLGGVEITVKALRIFAVEERGVVVVEGVVGVELLHSAGQVESSCRNSRKPCSFPIKIAQRVV